MRTELLFDPAMISARCKYEEHLRAAAMEQAIAAQRVQRRRYAPVVRLGQRLIAVGERLEAVAEQPA